MRGEANMEGERRPRGRSASGAHRVGSVAVTDDGPRMVDWERAFVLLSSRRIELHFMGLI